MRQLVFLNYAEIWRLAARMCALTHCGQTCSCTCMFFSFLFFLFLGYRGGLFSGPQSLPIPRQVHMCFISRQACWTVNSYSGAGLGIKTSAEGITSLCLIFFSFFVWVRDRIRDSFSSSWTFPSSAVPLLVPASHYGPPFLPAKLVYSSSNSASARCCAGKFLWTFFLCLCQSAFLIISGLFFFLQPPIPFPPPHLPTSSLCPLIPLVRAVPALFLFMFLHCVTARAHNSKH